MKSNELQRKPCLRCLLREMPDMAELAMNLRELIAMIPEDERTPENVVLRRLNACRECPHLNRGTCGLCGCYVEHRSERRNASCPDLPPRWKE